MFKAALKSLLGHKLRMFLTAFSIVIGVSFVAGTYIFTDSMSKTFNGIFENARGSVDVIVRATKDPDFGSTPSAAISSDTFETVKSVQGIDKIEAELGGFAQLIDADGNPIGGNGPPSLGFSWGRVPELNALRIKEGNGRPPQADGEIVIDVNTAQTHNFSIGDTVRVQSVGPVQEFTIVGLASFGETDTLAGATISAFEYNQAARLFGLGDKISQINMSAQESVTPEELKGRVASVLSSGVEAVTGEQQSNEQLDQLNQGLGFVTTALLAFAAVSIFVGSFIIQNTFRIIIAQRSKELALLRAIGASRGQVVRMVLYEALLTAIIASALGVLAGIGVSSALRAAANGIGLGLPAGDLTVAARTIYVSFAVGIGVTLVSALAPAIKASRVAPVEAMRDIEMSRPAESLRRRALAGFLVVLLGAGLMAVGLFRDVTKPLYFVGAGAAIMFIGVAVIAPLLTGVVANIIAVPLLLRYKIIGKIARQNTKRSPRRSASTASALMIGVSLVVFSSILASSVRASIDVIVADNFPGDIIIQPKNNQGDPVSIRIPTAIAEDIAELDEIELVSTVIDEFAKINDEVTIIEAIDTGTFNDVTRIKPSNDSYSELKKDTVYINADALIGLGKSVGDTIPITYPNGESKTLRIAGTFAEAYNSAYLISKDTHAAYFPANGFTFGVANVADGVKFEDAKAAVAKVMERYPTAKVQDKNEFVADARKQIDQVLALLTVLLAFAIIIAILGITNTLTLSVSERTREIGMLRAVGMTRRQVRQMIRAESIIIAVFGALLGVLLGIFFAWAILRALQDEGFKAFSIPLLQIVIYLIMAAFAGVLAAITPSYKASRMNILRAINYE